MIAIHERAWSESEDMEMRRIVEDATTRMWESVATECGRTVEDCRSRWQMHAKKTDGARPPPPPPPPPSPVRTWNAIVLNDHWISVPNSPSTFELPLPLSTGKKLKRINERIARHPK